MDPGPPPPSPIPPPADVQVVRQAAVAAAMLKPIRRQILERLGEPDSAAGLARRLGMPRQRLNHHLRELERAGLVELVEERRKGNCTERRFRATARSYLISPEALGDLGANAAETLQDRFSWSYLVAVAGRAIRDLGILRRRALEAGQRLATFTLQAEVRCASAAALHAFSEELANEVARLIARHHDESAPHGRTFNFFVGAYPAITRPERGQEPSAQGEST